MNLEISSSDHCPLWLDPVVQMIINGTARSKFENAWVREPMCRQIVRDSWDVNSIEPWQRKIKCCSTTLAEWGKSIT